ncbi:MAG: hypothetical protein ACKOC7_05235, partial [Sphingomonadales bacterium]
MRINFYLSCALLFTSLSGQATAAPQHPGKWLQQRMMAKASMQQRSEPDGPYVQVVDLLKRLNKEKGIYFLLADPSIARLMVKEPISSRTIQQVVEDMATEAGLTYKK